jgi:phosphoserine phosphatase
MIIEVENIDETKRLQESLQVKANEYRANRDELNNQIKQLVNKRNELNNQIKQLIMEGYQHKKRRDELNLEVAEIKKKKDKLNRDYGGMIRKAQRAEQSLLNKDEYPLDKLKKDAHRIEFEQMTAVLSIKDEKKLIEQLSKLKAKISEREMQIKQDKEIRAIIKKSLFIKEELKKHHAEIIRLAKKAQEEHDKYLDSIKKSNELSKEVKELQPKIIVTKNKADKVHKEYIDLVNQIYELERKLAEMKKKDRKTKQEEVDLQVKKEASEIYKDFKSGKKLSTKDLIILQKAGLI